MDTFHPDFSMPDRQRSSALDHAIQAYAHNDADPLSWESLSATATLVVTPDGAPIRTIVTGRKHVTTGSYASRKAGRGLPYESMAERAFFMSCEVDTDVVDYRAQPFRFEFVNDGRKRVYIVDCVRLLSDGSIEIVEVKHDVRGLRDPDYAAKLEAVRLVCECVGWHFRIALHTSLRASSTFDDVVDIQSWRFTHFSQGDAFCVASAVAQGVSTLGNLASALSKLGRTSDEAATQPLALAKLKAMVVKRIIRFDLSKKLSLDTRVDLVADQGEILQ